MLISCQDEQQWVTLIVGILEGLPLPQSKHLESSIFVLGIIPIL